MYAHGQEAITSAGGIVDEMLPNTCSVVWRILALEIEGDGGKLV